MTIDRIFLASCFAFADQRCAGFFRRLGDALESRGIRLVMLATQKVAGFPYPVLDIPYSLYGFNDRITEECSAPFHPVAPLLAAEYAWSGYLGTTELCSMATARCEWFYRGVIHDLKPFAAMLWNTTHPHSRVARNVLQVHGVPAWCIERGQLAGSYQVQMGEVNAWDDTLATFSLHAGLQGDMEYQGKGAFEAARALSTKNPVDRYPVDAASLAAWPLAGHRSVLLLSSAIGSSIEPRGQHSIALSQPIWRSFQDAIDALDAHLPDNCTILFRDHPINRLILAENPLRKPSRFMEADKIPIGDLISSVDRVICVGTTTLQYEVLLRDKPLLVFGNSLAARAGAAYSCLSSATLKSDIDSWLNDVDAASKRRNARHLIGILCNRHLVREDDRHSHIRHGIDQLADFIAAQAPAMSSST
ncbi:MAG: hypothetical protein IT476_08110 [Rhodanobacteraceae bacterium]|nr:hypothetical protein [Rhodanobacteraceae bacterium]